MIRSRNQRLPPDTPNLQAVPNLPSQPTDIPLAEVLLLRNTDKDARLRSC
jgi:hypothetical protein